MGRKDEEKKRADQIKAEQDFILHQKMDNLGIADFNHDIPPDEVDEKDVERSWYKTFKSMVPYTNDWYEAKQAEEEMDGLQAIRIEQNKAKNLLALAKLPNRGDEALRKLMAETNNDFHYFNRLKMTKMQELDKDGNPKYVEPPPKKNPFQDAAGGKNRVKKAVKKPYEIFDEAALNALSKKHHGKKDSTKEESKEDEYNPADEDASCTWRGKSVHGEWLKCTNIRQRHPYLTVYKPDGSETPKITKFCGYHQPTCIDVDTHEADGQPPKIPTTCVNIHGLCNTCLETAKDIDTSLPTATTITAPGVTPVDIALEAKKAALVEAEKETKDEITEQTRCRWRPNAKESLTHVREYICKNTCYRNPETGGMIPYCAMHAKACVMDHGSDPGMIIVPNVYGLCTMHHMALHKCEPVEVAFPYPGMEHKGAANAWRLRPGHWAAPNWHPKDIKRASEWDDPGPPDGIQHFKNQINKILYFIRLRIFGRRVATKIQALWAKYKLQKRHRVMKFEKRRPYRMKKCIVIQTQMRRFLGARRHEERRLLHLKLVAWISSHWRGFIYRLATRRDKASRSIVRFFKYIKSLKFKESVWMLLYIKRSLQEKILKAILIQSMVRGLIARRYVRSIYLYRFHCNYRARQIGRTMRHCMTRKRRARIVRPPSEAIMRAFLARRLGLMITEMWRDRERRQNFRQSLVQTLPEIQRMFRGYIGIKGTKKLLYLREALRTWCQPKFAVQFLQKQLTKSVLMFPPKVEIITYTTLRKESIVGDTIIDVHSTDIFKLGMKILVGSGNHKYIEKKIIDSFEGGIVLNEPLKHPHKEGELVRIEKLKPEKPKHTRIFLPERHMGKKVPRNSEYYPYAIFDECIRKWYEMKGFCLLNSELEAIVKIFRNPQDARMFSITGLDDLIEQHEKPCRKHGRAICGECIYFGECMMPKCKCQCFKGGEGTHSATCSNCPHTSTQHRTVPLQVKEKTKTATLLSLLHAPRMPDMSMPDAVDGVRLSKALDIKKPIPKKKPGAKEDDEISEADTDYDDYSIGSEEEDAIDPEDKVYVTKESNWKMIGTAESLVPMKETQSLNLVKSLSASAKWETPDCEVMIPKQEVEAYALLERGETIAENDEYWDYIDMSTVKAAANSEIPAKIENFECSPEAEKITTLKFWDSVTKNPNKSLRDYDEGFEHNIPVPIVIDKEIVYTFEGPKLYFSLLMQILDLEDRIHYDDSAFLRLVTDHIQVFERHWRKFVSDIREGTLDRRCGVDAETRKLYEATAIPKPSIAKQLDNAFRDLGFHSKALGKDIKIVKHAELKRKPIKDPRARRPSLPKQEIMETLQLPDRSVTETCSDCGGIGIVFHRAAKVKCKKCNGVGTITTLPSLWSPPTSPMTKSRPGSQVSRVGTGNSRAMSKQEKRKMVGEALTNGMVEELLKAEGEIAVRGPSRKNTREGRRGSETDIARPATSQELQKIAQADLTTQPRAEYHDIVFDNGRFLCPFPACGQSFKSKDAAFKHISVHELRTRLSAPTPLPDSFMNFYWPKGVPWLEQKKFTKSRIPPGSLMCPVEGCSLVFPNKARLESHLKVVHKKNTVGSFFDFTIAGDFIKVPPYPNPTNAPLLYCTNHVTALAKCSVCVEVEVANGPKPPLKFFGSVEINFTQKELDEAALMQTKGRVKGETNVHGDHKHIFSASHQSGVCVRGGTLINREDMRLLADVDPTANASKWNGRIIGLLQDANGEGWIALQRLYTARELEARGYTGIVSDNRLFELFYLPNGEQAIWTKMKNIENNITLFDGNFTDFQEARKIGVFGDIKTNLYYVLPIHHHHSES